MRVLLWSEIFWPNIGGIEIISASLATALRDRGHEVLIVSTRTNPEWPTVDEYQGIPVRRFDFRDVLESGRVDDFVAARREVIAVKKSFQPDVIHMNAYGPSSPFHLGTTSAWQAPSVLTLQADIPFDEETGPATTTGQLFRRVDWVTCVSDGVLAQFRERVPEMSERSSTIYNAVEQPRIAPTPLPVDEPRLLCLGRVVPQKGFDVALRAWSLIRDRFPRARMMIAGDGESRQQLEQLTDDLGIRSSVDFVGWIPPGGVPEVINSSTMVVMPSRREGLPLVAMESAMMARPVVGTRVIGLAEAVVDGKTGLLVDPDDANALANAIAHLLEHPKTATEFGAAARRRARDDFDWQRSVDKYCELYEQIVQEAAHGKVVLSAP